MEHDITSLSKQIDNNLKESRSLRQKLIANEDDLASINLEEMKQLIEEIDIKIKKEEQRLDVSKVRTKKNTFRFFNTSLYRRVEVLL